METYSLWLNNKNKPKIKRKLLSPSNGPNSLIIKTLYSGISKGTEKLVSSGSISKDQYKIMQSPFQEGTFSFPIKYGYFPSNLLLAVPRPTDAKYAYIPFGNSGVLQNLPL